MTLQECYAALGGNYDEVIGRLRTERMVQKFVLKFLNDGSYDLLVESMGTKNYSEAFRAAHTIKGVCQNLSFTKLYESASELSEALRPCQSSADAEPLPTTAGLVEQVKEDYEATATAIQTFQAGLG